MIGDYRLERLLKEGDKYVLIGNQICERNGESPVAYLSSGDIVLYEDIYNENRGEKTIGEIRSGEVFENSRNVGWIGSSGDVFIKGVDGMRYSKFAKDLRKCADNLDEDLNDSD
jgi:hypothetical protein